MGHIVLFSERTRGIHGQCMIGNGHKPFTSLQPTASAGVAVLIPLLHVRSVNATLRHAPSIIDWCFWFGNLRSIGCRFHASCSLMTICYKFRSSAYFIILGVDFNTQICFGPRGAVVDEFISMFALHIANGGDDHDWPWLWFDDLTIWLFACGVGSTFFAFHSWNRCRIWNMRPQQVFRDLESDHLAASANVGRKTWKIKNKRRINSNIMMFCKLFCITMRLPPCKHWNWGSYMQRSYNN